MTSMPPTRTDTDELGGTGDAESAGGRAAESGAAGSSAAGTSSAGSSAAQAEAADPQLDELCPVVEAVDRLGSRWRLTVLHELQGGERRFNELKRATGANARTLSRVLDDLQEYGLVERRVEAESPIASYYELTEPGQSLCPVFDELRDWGEAWILDGPVAGGGGDRSSGAGSPRDGS